MRLYIYTWVHSFVYIGSCPLSQDNYDDDPFGLYTDYMDKLLSQSPESSSHATNTRRLVTGTSAIYTTTTAAPIHGETPYTQVVL